ncbi:uncharacterized protein LOC117328461 [Pecten maximus]|uniref:uncharacterized protein LOC117328461 n=1 Tax=Pecten maximus TaxID=6579 RepID=UPI00145863A8|nr:uncharacterized protein LOC117328461 [Pecten maximus]
MTSPSPPPMATLNTSQPSTPPPSSDNPPAWAIALISPLISKVDTLTSKLSKLDSLEKVFRDLHEDVKNLKVRLDDIEESQTFINRKFEETRVYHTDLSKLHDDVIDLKCRSMRENLLFFGIPEEGGPDFVDRSDPTTGISERVPNEDCIDKLKTLASQKLDFTENLLIDRAHRIGPKTTGKEVQEVRRELWPIWKKARDDKKRAVFVKDKLYIDGVLYKCPDPPVPSANVQAPGNPRGAPKGAHTRKRHQ